MGFDRSCELDILIGSMYGIFAFPKTLSKLIQVDTVDGSEILFEHQLVGGFSQYL